jgi:hypothetical protein
MSQVLSTPALYAYWQTHFTTAFSQTQKPEKKDLTLHGYFL